MGSQCKRSAGRSIRHQQINHLVWRALRKSRHSICQRTVRFAAERKVSKYAGLSASHLFVPIAIETLGPINEAGHSFLSELERRLSTISNDSKESFFLFQRICIPIQRFNEFAFRGTFDEETGRDEQPLQSVLS